MPLPASLLLQPDCSIKPGWAVFDQDWYLETYGDRLDGGVARTQAGLLAYYLRSGCVAGQSPSPFFDEITYISANPGIAALIKSGRYACGFDHFCQLGHRIHSGHWLFDDALYDSLYDDMSLENLDANGFYGRYDHYLRSGQFEHRQPHLLFDSRFFAASAVAAGDDAGHIEKIGPFTHFLYRLQSNAAELPPSAYFDPAWVAGQAQKSGSAIARYLQGGLEDDLDPVPEFSGHFYRERNPDVQAALDAGLYFSAYQHFLQTGVFEFRQPSPSVDLIFYRDANPAVRNDLNTGAARDAFAHLRAIGRQAGLPSAPPEQNSGISEAGARELFIRRARDNLPLFARRKIDFTEGASCALSVIMVMFETFELTLQALASLRGNSIGDVQLILVDNGSTDATVHIEHHVTGAKIIRLDRNIGYARACNLALQEVTGEFVLFLNHDAELGFGAVDAAIARMRLAPDLGAVGGKIIRAHGTLQEAGCIIWQDGSAGFYMRDAPPLAAEANFVRDVDFCSRVFLLCRSEAIKNLGGFDPDFGSAYYGEADLCLRLAACGYRIMYDPAITVHHLDCGGAGVEVAQALSRRGQKIFAQKHAMFLKTRPVNAPQHLTAARSPEPGRKNILFIEDIIPRRCLGAGYVRANDIVRAIAAAGYAVSVFPVDWADSNIDPDLPDDVEILYDRDISQLGECLATRRGYYDLIWISRTHNLNRILPIFLSEGIDPARIPFVLDTEAIGTVRDAARMRLAGVEDFDFAPKLRNELEGAERCCHCLAVNEYEASLLRSVGLAAVSVLGTARRPDPAFDDFSTRRGLLFVASFHQPDSPNLDALFWYVEEILPALREEMEAVPVLNVAGYVAPEIDLTPFSGHPHIKIHGPAISLRPHYEKNRLFIAPTRFAAGTPYKLYEAASFGLPIVATALLAAQLNWQDGIELLTAPVGDAKRFAAQIARLYQAPAMWARLRENVLERIACENTVEAFNERVADILGTAFSAPRFQIQNSLFCAGRQPSFSSCVDGPVKTRVLIDDIGMEAFMCPACWCGG